MAIINHPEYRPLRVAVLLSGGGSTLANILAARDADRLAGAQIVRVLSSRTNVHGVTIARQAGIDVDVVRPRDFNDAAAFSSALTTHLDAANPDLVVMAGFLCHWLLPARYQRSTLNIHPALLPKFGGRGMFGEHVHRAVLAAREPESGCTVHLVDQEYDHGPIITQRRVPVLSDDDPHTLAARVQAAEREVYPQVIERVAREGGQWLARAAAMWARGEDPLA